MTQDRVAVIFCESDALIPPKLLAFAKKKLECEGVLYFVILGTHDDCKAAAAVCRRQFVSLLEGPFPSPERQAQILSRLLRDIARLDRIVRHARDLRPRPELTVDVSRLYA